MVDLPALAVALETPRPSFDAIGQRDEALRHRLGVMLDRLDDLKTLQEDFADIMSPLVRISEDLSRASVRAAELEALLGQERQSSGALRQEAADLNVRLSSVGNELSGLGARASQAEAAVGERDQTIEELRVVQRDGLLMIENLERQLFGETEQNKALLAENKALRVEAQTVDTALARAEHDLHGVRERIAVLEQDNRRLQAISEEQGGQLAELEGRRAEYEAAAESDRQRVSLLESQLAAETSARERSEAQAEAEAAAHRTERAGLAMKLESAENRAASTAQLLGQTRNQLREKDEAYRGADRSLKEAIIAKATSDRRHESAQADLARQTERFVEMQRLKGDLDARSAMLTKALAAKDAALDQTVARNAALNERIEQLASRHEAARAELDTANRRLTEDLQNEKAERALMQGALEIARESRGALQKQHEALKRSSRGWREATRDEPENDEQSNVHPINSGAKPA
ncbi:hypothetical protein [Methylopila sp. M107]|uniref:hypothetical protein n=1 Tax=Methylopila sp. M107 TaxID=1101190 RepID=UPI00039CBBAE|nr:hypothetical protein [Methylopila sp. M107]